MITDATLGPAAPERGWVPAPRYLLRRALVLRELRSIAPCEALEVGPGPGMLLHELSALGFPCRALEMSDTARTIGTALAGEAGRDIRFFEHPQPDWGAHFGLLMAFEVLEHIEDDTATLRQWRSWLRPGGTLLLSVPCHMKQWNPADVWAGHVRRYEHEQLSSVAHAAGFEVETLLCYGFPLANVTEHFRAKTYAHDIHGEADTTVQAMHDNTARSGTDRHHEMKWFPLLKSPLGKLAITSADLVQRLFLGTELGNGYLLRARAV